MSRSRSRARSAAPAPVPGDVSPQAQTDLERLEAESRRIQDSLRVARNRVRKEIREAEENRARLVGAALLAACRAGEEGACAFFATLLPDLRSDSPEVWSAWSDTGYPVLDHGNGAVPAKPADSAPAPAASDDPPRFDIPPAGEAQPAEPASAGAFPPMR